MKMDKEKQINETYFKEVFREVHKDCCRLTKAPIIKLKRMERWSLTKLYFHVKFQVSLLKESNIDSPLAERCLENFHQQQLEYIKWYNQ